MNGQYTLDADPMVLAERIKKLEHAMDSMCAAMIDLTNIVRVTASATEAAVCEAHPLQVNTLDGLQDGLTHVHDLAHQAGVLMGRSY